MAPLGAQKPVFELQSLESFSVRVFAIEIPRDESRKPITHEKTTGHLCFAAGSLRCAGTHGPPVIRLRPRGCVGRAASGSAPAAGYHPADPNGEAREVNTVRQHAIESSGLGLRKLPRS
jgi:hypothetical protein